MERQQLPNQQSATYGPETPEGKDYLRSVGLSIAQAQRAKQAEDAGRAGPNPQPPELKAPRGDILQNLMAGSETQTQTPSESQPPSDNDAAGRIQQLLAEKKDYEARSVTEAASRSQMESELAELRKERETREQRGIIRDALVAEGQSSADFDGDGAPLNVEGTIDKIMAKLNLQKNGITANESTMDPEVASIVEERKIMTELTALAPDISMTAAQMSALVEARKASPGLSAVESIAVAQMRQPSLFPMTDRRGFDPQVHNTTTPTGATSSSRIPPSTDQREAEFLSHAVKSSGEERTMAAQAALSQNPHVRRAFNHIHRTVGT